MMNISKKWHSTKQYFQCLSSALKMNGRLLLLLTAVIITPHVITYLYNIGFYWSSTYTVVMPLSVVIILLFLLILWTLVGAISSLFSDMKTATFNSVKWISLIALAVYLFVTIWLLLDIMGLYSL